MRDIVITSSVLILAILLIRTLVKGKINPCLQYALWMLVVIRLLLPAPLWNSRVSVMNFFPESMLSKQNGSYVNRALLGKDKADGVPITGTAYGADELSGVENISNIYDLSKTADISDTDTDLLIINNTAATDNSISGMKEFTPIAALSVIYSLIPFIWAAGIIFTGGYMLFYQIKWKHYVRKNRKPFEGMEKYKGRLSVYTIKGLPSPCLSGRSIYLTKEMAADKAELEHILTHEYCHYIQLDSVWVIVRCVLTIIYWFNPLVWAAAYISKQDSELSCDELAIKMLGEDERLAYGKTLVKLVSGDTSGRYRMGIASTMNGGEKGIKERISMIAGKPKYFAAAAAFILVVAAALTVVTFSGAGHKGGNLVIIGESKDLPVNGEPDSNNVEELDLTTMKDQIEAEYEAIEAYKAENEAKQKQIEQLQEELKAKEEAVAAAEAKAREEAFMVVLDRYDEQIMTSLIQGNDADIKNPSDYIQSYVNQGEEALDEGIYKLAELKEGDNSSVAIYGVYTKEYGCMGIKTLIGEDINNFAIRWIPSGLLDMEGNISVYGKSQDGLPRVFAWKTLSENSSETEVWDLYISDRYDTGTLSMYQFSKEDYYKQLKECLTFGIVQSEGKIYVYDNGEAAGELNIYAYTQNAETSEMKKIEEVVLDSSRINWELGDKEDELKLITAVGLKYEGMDAVWYEGLNPIAVSVECGNFGERSFALGKASVETDIIVKGD